MSQVGNLRAGGRFADCQSAIQQIDNLRHGAMGAVSVSIHHGGPHGAKPKGEVEMLYKIRNPMA